MLDQKNTTILIVPGLRDHVPEHWQTLLEARLPAFRSIPPLETNKLDLAARIAAIEKTINEIDGQIIVVAHSGGTIMFAHWAQRHSTEKISGALLAVPPDFEKPLPAGYPTIDEFREKGWLPVPRAPLPFRSIVTVSENDPLGEITAVSALAGDWKSQVINLGRVGHLNPASGYGDWPDADALIQRLIDAC
ncbi:hypothetical protein SAMN04515620_11637 [Collimonas sp. OK607]|uniref:RBBP9/YdeN family alpha/beta hydrolase n=1 Tax=Collimonas sp. OK607 TaxID=1798194 RepID=UPI0008E8A407|nr:alpha/beta hydrolase [Collimonas sp. OK607]SFB07591.1 hypothetical protein SAMN04515620_11637 [Collimonas sp. OK607]